MANYSKAPSVVLQAALNSGYSRVRFQQGKPILDRELNLAADLVSPERLVQQYIGDGVPAGSTGFQISNLNVATGDFSILPGTCRVAGLEIVLAGQTTYRTQPNVSNVGPLPAGASNVYLRVFTGEVTSAQDADLANAPDVGVETAVRQKNDWEVLVSAAPINDAVHFLLAVINLTTNTVVDGRRTGLTLAAVKDEVAAARGSAADLSGRLNKSLAADGSMLPGIVSIQKMVSTLVSNTQVSIAAAPAAGQVSEQIVTLLNTDNQAFLLVSAHFDAPRAVGPTVVAVTQTFEWRHRVALVKPPGSNIFSQHLHQVVIQNPNLFSISVTCKAYSVSES
jgi:hypothetical protein